VLGYSNAKAAIDNFTRWMATEMAIKYGDGIRDPAFLFGVPGRAHPLEGESPLRARQGEPLA
jgi:hypothetical protein